MAQTWHQTGPDKFTFWAPIAQERLEQYRTRAVPPRMLERELELAVGEPLEPFLCDRWASDVTAEPLEPAVRPAG